MVFFNYLFNAESNVNSGYANSGYVIYIYSERVLLDITHILRRHAVIRLKYCLRR